MIARDTFARRRLDLRWRADAPAFSLDATTHAISFRDKLIIIIGTGLPNYR